MYSERINKAFVMAADFHRNQLRKGENHPYIIHPFEVFLVCYDLNCEEDTLVAALLHDVVEDTDCTEDDVRNEFGSNVLKIVISNTETDKSLSWKERKQHTLDTLDGRTQEELKMFLADKYVNLNSFINAYNLKGEKMWEAFHAGKEQQKWYHNELYRKLNDLLENNDKTREYLDAFKDGCSYLFGE